MRFFGRRLMRCFGCWNITFSKERIFCNECVNDLFNSGKPLLETK